MVIPYIDENVQNNICCLKLRKPPVVQTKNIPNVWVEEKYEDSVNNYQLIADKEGIITDFIPLSGGKYKAYYFINEDNAKQVETPTMDTFTKDSDKVNHPNHYQSKNGIEVIDVIEAFIADLQGIVAFDIGNALKYLCRWKHKGGVEDLKKAKWYIDHAIEKAEKQ